MRRLIAAALLLALAACASPGPYGTCSPRDGGIGGTGGCAAQPLE